MYNKIRGNGMEEKKELIKRVVYKFMELSKTKDTKVRDDFINKLCSCNIDDSVDLILISLSDLVNKDLLSTEDITSNVDLLLDLNRNKYHTIDDLINRLNYIKSMNLEHPSMSLRENHELVTLIFDKFNELIQTDFDCFYTGGLMGYIAVNHPLKRYHSDLDLFINEEQLFALYELVKNSDDFEFISNMEHKSKNGHEYKITYRKTPITIGLFLFSRLTNNEMVLKEYYYENDHELYVDEHHLKEEYTNLAFQDDIKEHNKTFYRMQTLEGIYNAKKNSRPKDKYDANVIKPFIDIKIDHKLDNEKGKNYDVNHQLADGSVVEKLEEVIKKDNVKIK